MKKMRTSSKTTDAETRCSVYKFMELEAKEENGSKPTRRSGHRAICTKSDLYVWGGYCPLSDTARVIDPTRSPLFPEVLNSKFLESFKGISVLPLNSNLSYGVST
jgi:hypothetical protein